jgi:hypothetical protein
VIRNLAVFLLIIGSIGRFTVAVAQAPAPTPTPAPPIPVIVKPEPTLIPPPPPLIVAPTTNQGLVLPGTTVFLATQNLTPAQAASGTLVMGQSGCSVRLIRAIVRGEATSPPEIAFTAADDCGTAAPAGIYRILLSIPGDGGVATVSLDIQIGLPTPKPPLIPPAPAPSVTPIPAANLYLIVAGDGLDGTTDAGLISIKKSTKLHTDLGDRLLILDTSGNYSAGFQVYADAVKKAGHPLEFIIDTTQTDADKLVRDTQPATTEAAAVALETKWLAK